MKRKRVYVVALVLAVSLILILTTAGTEKEVETKEVEPVEPIKIGVLLDLSALASVFESMNYQGYDFAIEEIGGSIAGRPIELIYEDHGWSPKIGMDKARKLAERDKVVMIWGVGYSGIGLAVAPYFTEHKIPMITNYAYDEILSKKDNWMFFPLGNCATFGYASGVFAAEELGAKTAITAAMDFTGAHEYVQGFVEGFESRGGKVIQKQAYATDVVDFSTYILNMEEADVLGLCIFGTMDVPFFRQYRELVEPGKRPIVWIWDEFDLPVNRQLGTIPAEIPVYSAQSFSFKDAQTKEEFYARYEKSHGSPPPLQSPFYLAYNTATIGLKALQMTGGEGGEALYEALTTMDFENVLGRVKFTNRMMDSVIEMLKAEVKGDDYEMVSLKRYRTHGEWNSDKTKLLKNLVKE